MAFMYWHYVLHNVEELIIELDGVQWYILLFVHKYVRH